MAKTEDQDLSLVTAGFFGAVAGAISAIVITALIDKKTRSRVGEAILHLREQATQTVKDLTKISKEVEDSLGSDTKDSKFLKN